MIYTTIKVYQRRPEDWRVTLTHTCLIWGTFLALATEILSILKIVDHTGLILAWSLVCITCILLIYHKGFTFQIPRMYVGYFPFDWSDKLVIGLLIFVAVTTFVVARLSPPQTWDSLNYHLPRIAHWAQEKSINHFATGIEVQNVISPGGEIIQLHVYILGQGDRWISIVQWAAMLISLVTATWVASLLGAGRSGQLLSGLVVATIPMGIIQASSTANDYIVTLWVLISAAEAFVFIKDRSINSMLYSGTAAGLSLWTKPTSLPYLIPFGVLILYTLSKIMWHHRAQLRKYILAASIGLLCLILINSGYWFRNQRTYLNPFGDPIRIDTHRNQIFTPAGILSNLLRNMAFHTGLPWGRANKLVYESMVQIHEWIDLDIEDPRTTSVGPYPWMAFRTNEESAGNTLHAGLILICFVFLLTRNFEGKPLYWLYGLICAGTFLLFSIIFKWQIFGSRYHLPFFVLFSPFIGSIFNNSIGTRILKVIPIILTFCALPWLFSIDSRPLIPNDQALIGSILQTPEIDIRFANAQYQLRSYTQMAGLIKDAGCNQIGISLGGIQTEYFIWDLLGAPRGDLQIEWFVAGTQSEMYRDTQFRPCAIICELCTGPGSEAYNGIPRIYMDEEFTLYLTPPKP